MTITLNGTTGITTPAVTNEGAYTGDGVVFADATPSNTLVTTTGGNVGIGTSSPSTLLHTYTSAQESIRFARNSTSSSAYVTFYANNSSSAQVQYAGILGDVASSTAGSHGGNLLFYITGSGTSAERMRIDSSGNLLVGVTATGSITNGVTVTNPTTATILNIGHVTGTGSGSDYIVFRYNGSNIGSITQNGTTNTAYNTSSDYRLKENIAPMTGALAVVGQLKPCTYTWKSDGSDGQGFIAHELAEVVPDCVTGAKDGVDEEGNPKYQGIDTSFLVATLTAAIQEQQAIITEQANAITALEARLTALEQA